MQPFAPRQVLALPPVVAGDWRIKRYAVSLHAGEFVESRFDAGRARALATLPLPAVTDHRIGVGFLIEHQGNGADYAVLCWWDRENELPIRVFVAEHEGEWRPATGSESICVWDLEIIWAERQAYLATILSHNGVDVERYVSATTIRAG